ncbi:hypothetical protein FI667_g15042, partial [Globisporangium splendens]
MESSNDFAAATEENAKLSPNEQVPRLAALVRIRIQRVYLSVVSLTLLTAIVVLMCLCANGGITLETFDSKEKDSAVQATLVSQYNSYSGYLVSALAQPIELFFPIVIAVAFLCFATEFSLRGSTLSSQSEYAVLAVSERTMRRIC